MRMMLATLVALALAVLVAAPAAAQMPPVNGVYLSTNYGGPVLNGRFSESWVNPGSHGQIGNTIDAASWDGAALAGQWRVWCASIIAPPVLVADTRDGNGTGDVTYRTLYGGGRIWLSRLGPWSADNLVDFTGTIETFTVVTTYQYVFGSLLGIRSNVTTSAHLDRLFPWWSETCMDFTINNAAFYGTTDIGPLPAGYPLFLDPLSCPSGTSFLQRGGWGDVTHIAVQIMGCVVPSEITSWGVLKSRFDR